MDETPYHVIYDHIKDQVTWQIGNYEKTVSADLYMEWAIGMHAAVMSLAAIKIPALQMLARLKRHEDNDDVDFNSGSGEGRPR
jgi:hypothetical protein